MTLCAGGQRSLSWALRRPIARGHVPVFSRRNVASAAIEKSNWSHYEPPPQTRPPTPSSSRMQALQNAQPFSDFLTDGFGRQHDYLRISITERCNLRCLYCMPEEGVQLSPNERLLTSPEIYYISSLFVSQGVTKIRLTGGEPTIRPDIIPLMRQIGSLRTHGLRELALTTNGISLHRKLEDMVEAGLTGINISLDTLDPFQFQIMTRRKGFDAVMKSIDKVLDMKSRGTQLKLKINCVVMRGINERILPFVELARDKDIEVRFIEYMPFDGNKWSKNKMISYQEMLDVIRAKYPGLRLTDGHRNDTSKTWEIPGFVGKMGFITSMTHNFCGTCNRLRITSDGNLKVCLFGNSEVSLRDLLREGNSGQPIDQVTFDAIRQLESAEAQVARKPAGPSAWAHRESRLLDTIGQAVKRKKEKHAGIGELETMKNRPMILIDESHRYGSSGIRKRHFLAMPYARSNIAPSNPAWHTPIMAASPSATYLRALSTRYSRPPRGPRPSGPEIGRDQKETAVADETTAGDDADPRNFIIRSVRRPRSSDDFTLRKHSAHSAAAKESFSRALPADEEEMPSSITAAPRELAGEALDTTTFTHGLSHLTSDGELNMVDVSAKSATHRHAVAVGTVIFSKQGTHRSLFEQGSAKGNVITTAQLAGIQAAKQTSALIPLCHNIPLSKVHVEIKPFDAMQFSQKSFGGVQIVAVATAVANTGVEMEALTAVMGSALTVIDMGKAVDKGMILYGVRVVYKNGGRSGLFEDRDHMDVVAALKKGGHLPRDG